MKIILQATISVAILTSPAKAEYVATSQIKANYCVAFGFLCKSAVVDAVGRDESGKDLGEIQSQYDSVDEFINDTCWINIPSRGVVFYTLKDEVYMPLSGVDYVHFDCMEK